MIAALIPQNFKVKHEHNLSSLFDAQLQQRLIEAQNELAAVGWMIDVEATEVKAAVSEIGCSWKTE